MSDIDPARLAAARAHGYDVEERRPNPPLDGLVHALAVSTGQREEAVRWAWGLEAQRG